jgi:DNA-binding NarL/FixJ family response regulator
MDIAIVTPVRLVGEGVAAALRRSMSAFQPAIFADLAALRQALCGGAVHFGVAIFDASHVIALAPVRDFHIDYPEMPLLALAAREDGEDIIALGHAGFSGYIGRDDGIEQLDVRIRDVLCGRLSCPPEIAAGMMRSLFDGHRRNTAPSDGLTPRERHVADLVSNGLSNKEIAGQLALSESTVKHHVHAVLGKLRLSSRFQLMRRARDDIWEERSFRQAS